MYTRQQAAIFQLLVLQVSLKFELEKDYDCKQEKISLTFWTEPSGVVLGKAKGERSWDGNKLLIPLNYALDHFMPVFYDPIKNLTW